MGLKDHLEDGIGHILDLGLDLDYLHVESADRLPGASTPRTGAMDKGVPDGGGGSDGAQSSNTSLGDSDESSDSEGETEQGHRGAGGEPGGVAGHAGRERLCHSPLLCPISGRPPDVPQDPPKRLKEYQTKMEFALKLGYAEGLVRLVLNKLGPEALINDVLGELVKLGKCDGEHASSSSSSSSQALSSPSPCPLPSASSACSSFPTHSPPQVDALDDKDNLRPIVVDGSNVAMSHGNKEVFSCHGIQLAVDWFLGHGHKDITVFVPAWRKEQSRPDAPITDQEILRRLEKEKILVFTPSRRVQGRRVVCYDDRFIVKLAYESDGIIVSNDNYRDLGNEKPEWKKFIDERLLMYSFVNDKFMPPDDPLGRHGPSLENFLRKRPVVPEHRKQPCPYGKKCTYGHKCKFYHPERGNQPQRSVADELRASARTSAAKSLGDAGLIKSQSMPSSFQSDGGPDVKPTVPRRQSDPSAHAHCYSDLEDRLGIKTKVEVGWNHSSSLPAPGGLPSYPQDPRGPPACMVTARRTPPFVYPDPYPRCDSPELSYYSMVNACSSLSLSAPRSPDRRRFPLDSELRLGSVASDCSSEGSISCSSSSDSYGARVSSPDPLLDDGLQYGHHHHHHRYPPHPHPPSQPYAHGYRQGMARVQGVGQEEPPNPHLKHTLPYPPPHFRHPAVGTRSGCPGDYSPLPQNRPVPQSPPLDHTLAPTHIEGISDSRYEQSLLQTRRPYQGHEHFSGWDSYHQHSHPRQLPTQPYYDQHAFRSMHESRKEAWPTPWGRPSATTHPAAAESHGGGRYQDVREKVFINLSNIFPPELVRLVMGRNPHVTDPQQLAVNILAEKSQRGY